MIEYNSALRCVLRHDLADLILLGNKEAVVEHFECLETGLPSKEDQQRIDAFFPTVSKPNQLPFNCNAI